MKRYWLLGIVVMIMAGCARSPQILFLNRVVGMDEGMSRIQEKNAVEIAALRYRWLNVNEAVVFGMDEEQNRGWWLWDMADRKFLPLSQEVQGFDVSGGTVMAIGRDWDGGFPLFLGRIDRRDFRIDTTIRLDRIPQNSIAVPGGFYLALKDDANTHVVIHMATNGVMTPVHEFQTSGGTLRFAMVQERVLAYISYDKPTNQPSMVAFLGGQDGWEEIPVGESFVQKAVSLGDVVAIPMVREGQILWGVFDGRMNLVSVGPAWNGVVFEELSDNLGKAKGFYLCLLPSEQRSVMMVFSWTGQDLQWRSFSP